MSPISGRSMRCGFKSQICATWNAWRMRNCAVSGTFAPSRVCASSRDVALRNLCPQCDAHSFKFFVQNLEVHFTLAFEILGGNISPGQAHLVDTTRADISCGAAQRVKMLAECLVVA